MIRKIWNGIIEGLFPKRCPICDDIVLPFGSDACELCLKKLEYVENSYCMKCGKPLKQSDDEFCVDCLNRKHFFAEGRSVFVYNEVMRTSIYRFKYGGRQEYAVYYAKEIERMLGRKIIEWGAQALIPVPLHKSRQRTRGYNQAQLIAEELGKRMNMRVVDDLLYRVKKTKAQKNLNAFERENNLKKAFKIVQNDVKLNSVILIDDIYTTGSTLDEAAHCLQECGIGNIYFIVLSIGENL